MIDLFEDIKGDDKVEFETKRVAVFVDGSNFFYAQKKMGWDVCPERLLKFCKQFGNIVEATYYSGESNDPKQKRFFDFLAYNGYSLVTKPLKTIYDHETGQITRKSNLDIEVALDMFNQIDRYDVAILVSGDSDFQRALQLLKSRGKEVKVVSARGIVATELVQTVGINYIDFHSIREGVERTNELTHTA